MDGLVEDICFECHSSSFAEHCANMEYEFIELMSLNMKIGIHIPLLDWSCNILHVNNLIAPSIAKNAWRMSGDKVLCIRIEFYKSVD